MPGGVIDEFLIKVGMEGDPSGLVDAYKQITKSQEGLERQTQEFEQKDSAADEKKQKRSENMQKFQSGVNTAVGKGIGLVKSGVGMARNWAVALLAVDGAAMAVIGRLSQMAVEYDNLAGSTNMSASELKAWEDTLKAAGGQADDVRSSMQAIYEKAFEISQGRGDPGTMQALQAFGVQTEEGGALRETGDIFSDIISGFRKSIEEGMDVNLAIGFLKQAGVSGMLAEPLRREKEGEYVASEKQFEKFLKLAQPLDDLADASIGLSTVITELSATFREKFAKVLLELVESSVLEDMLTKLTAFVAGIDTDAVAKVVNELLEVFGTLFTGLEKLVGFISFLIPGSKTQKEYQENLKLKIESGERADALIAAIGEASTGKQYREFAGFAGFGGTARGRDTPGGRMIEESEARIRAEELGLNISQIFEKANVVNNIKIDIDGKDIPYEIQESRENNNNNTAAMFDSGKTQ